MRNTPFLLASLLLTLLALPAAAQDQPDGYLHIENPSPADRARTIESVRKSLGQSKTADERLADVAALDAVIYDENRFQDARINEGLGGLGSGIGAILTGSVTWDHASTLVRRSGRVGTVVLALAAVGMVGDALIRGGISTTRENRASEIRNQLYEQTYLRVLERTPVGSNTERLDFSTVQVLGGPSNLPAPEILQNAVNRQ